MKTPPAMANATHHAVYGSGDYGSGSSCEALVAGRSMPLQPCSLGCLTCPDCPASPCQQPELLPALPQMEENLQRLEEDADFRGEYLAMWAQSRPKPDASSGDQPSSRPNVDEKVGLHLTLSLGPHRVCPGGPRPVNASGAGPHRLMRGHGASDWGPGAAWVVCHAAACMAHQQPCSPGRCLSLSFSTPPPGHGVFSKPM